MYRPKDWEKLGEHACSGDGCLECRDYTNKEAGADAILEAIWKMAKESPTGKFEIDSHIVNIYSPI